MRVIVLVVGALGLVNSPVTVLAQSQAPTNSVPVLVIKSGRRVDGATRATVTVSGKPVSFQGMSLYQSQGSLLVPLRPIGQALGAYIDFDARSQTVTAIRAGRTLRLQGGTTIGGRTLVPLRALSEGLGVKVLVQQSPNALQIALNPTGWSEGVGLTRQGVSTPARSGEGARSAAGIGQAAIQYNLTQLNALRTKAGVPPLQIDATLSAFALQGSLELIRTHEPHGHFKGADVWSSGFGRAAAENQGDPHGWFPGPTNNSIDQILRAMISEGPGGGHHDNILNPAYRRVGWRKIARDGFI